MFQKVCVEWYQNYLESLTKIRRQAIWKSLLFSFVLKVFGSNLWRCNLEFALFLERLAESLRTIPSSPGVQSAVFLCFRVILIRMSPQHVTSLWPLIITEMVLIFSYLEQELSTDSEEWRWVHHIYSSNSKYVQLDSNPLKQLILIDFISNITLPFNEHFYHLRQT